jgi:hypothetical protein
MIALETPVEAPAILLDPSRVYLLAICVAAESTVTFHYAGNYGANSLQACIGTYAECQAASGANRWIGFSSAVSVRTNSCPVPLPSPLALCGPTAVTPTTLDSDAGAGSSLDLLSGYRA